MSDVSSRLVVYLRFSTPADGTLLTLVAKGPKGIHEIEKSIFPSWSSRKGIEGTIDESQRPICWRAQFEKRKSERKKKGLTK